jgi:hypothetical protein
MLTITPAMRLLTIDHCKRSTNDLHKVRTVVSLLNSHSHQGPTSYQAILNSHSHQGPTSYQAILNSHSHQGPTSYQAILNSHSHLGPISYQAIFRCTEIVKFY